MKVSNKYRKSIVLICAIMMNFCHPLMGQTNDNNTVQSIKGIKKKSSHSLPFCFRTMLLMEKNHYPFNKQPNFYFLSKNDVKFLNRFEDYNDILRLSLDNKTIHYYNRHLTDYSYPGYIDYYIISPLSK
jgi:hypothetical protein